jgi:hypothetical protein
VARLSTRGRRDAPTRQPVLHLGDLALLLDDDALGHLPGPRIVRVAQGNARHVDSALVVRDHLDAEIDVRVARVRHGHVAHHLVVRDPILADGNGGGSAVPTVLRTLLGRRFLRRLLGPVPFVAVVPAVLSLSLSERGEAQPYGKANASRTRDVILGCIAPS